jgi:hypothetical protein
MSKYAVKLIDDGTRYGMVIHLVTWQEPAKHLVGQPLKDVSTEVWGTRPPRCTHCSGRMTAMLSNCAHARAVARHLSKHPVFAY